MRNIIKNLKIKDKLAILIVIMMIAIGGMSGISILFMNSINHSSTEIAENWMPSAIIAQRINTLKSDYRGREYRHILTQEREKMLDIEKDMARIEEEIDNLFGQYNVLLTDENDGAIIESARVAWDKYVAGHEQRIAASRENRKEEAIQLMMGEAVTFFDEATNKFLEVVNYNKVGGEKSSLESNQLYKTAVSSLLISLVCIMVLAIGTAIYISRSISKPLKEIDEVARSIAEGNLENVIHYESRDELGHLGNNFNKTVTRLRDYVNYIDEIARVLSHIAEGDLVFELTYDYVGEFAKVKEALENISHSLNHTMGQINEAASQVSAGSEDIAKGATELAQGATEQASIIEEFIASTDEISQNITESIDKVSQTGEISKASKEKANEGTEAMNRMLGSMDAISKSSKNISEIITIIDHIASQTNLLALNAAIESARAGEAGRGFAVVANEIRDLANRSSETVKEIEKMVKESLLKVEEGQEMASQTAKALEAIVESVDATAEIAEALLENSQEQKVFVEELVQGTKQLATVVEVNSSTSQESAAVSEELAAQAENLKNLIAYFKLKEKV